ncbi:flagellar motility protein MotE (MotC chaperone)/sporulation protein YlmC with PRC-barrel domain [Kitasatospora sp. MAA19]|uniref:magnesium transporter MgtE N-terminal domain-containing protein n=1 Tax=unclassified Kitasatospora TaxID=2633591 RepID=UPI0024749BEE|nr:CBS domain-containing protein [Kitasatospora sp. MAA19]MDH6705178.1 flagellar motility protein MotE (MotC chaperone)/sporulation protein YlmC with PRC-barrel domain [Kitasatospora sp. MAA19]
MAGPGTRVFISHLSALAVFDPNGDQVGRVRDVVVSLRLGGRPPRVLGLVVEVVGRRRIFLPMTRVTSLESGQVLTTGVINLRRFEQRPSETLVLAELLDRTVTWSKTGEDVTVLDVGMVQTRLREWEISRVFVQVGRAGRLRKGKGERLTLDWQDVTGFALPEQDQGAANLLATFDQLRAADLASVMHHLSAKRRAEVAAALDDERLADVLEELPEDDQVEIIGKLKDERAADILEAMDPDDAADLLSELPDDEAERLLQLMEPEEAEPVRRLLSYEENTAGGLMTTEPVVLEPDATVAEALARIRVSDHKPALAAQVYVCRPPNETPTGKYLGTVHFQRLLREPPYVLVGSLVDDDLDPLPPDTPLSLITSYLATYNLVSAPVVDEADHLIGAVTVDDVLDHLLPEDWRESVLHGHDDAGEDDPREEVHGGR